MLIHYGIVYFVFGFIKDLRGLLLRLIGTYVLHKRLKLSIANIDSFNAYKKGVGAPVLRGSLGAIVFGSKGSGGGIISFER